MSLPAFWNYHPLSETPFLLNLRSSWSKNKPLKGKKIIHNTPLSMESLCKVDVLIQGGAEVTLTRTKSIRPSTEFQTYSYISSLGIQYLPEHDMLEGREYEFDFVLDCGAELSKLICPRLGYVELTQTGTQVYRHLQTSVPIISVDDSCLKKLETFFGTGDGFIRAFESHSSFSLKNAPVLLFGYGKVGSGIAHFLLPKTLNLVAVDICSQALKRAKKNGIQSINTNNREAILKAINTASVIITATGVKNLIEDYYPVEMFKGKILANVGVEDEYGKAFSDEEVLGKKQPLNFLLDAPTQMRYLDPSFYAHNLACELILNGKLEPGYHSLPTDVDMRILIEWQELFKEDLSCLDVSLPIAA